MNLRLVTTQRMTRLRTLNKAQRKTWRAVFERTVVERQRLVRETIALHRLEPIRLGRVVVVVVGEGHEHGHFQLAGLPLPALLRFRGMWSLTRDSHDEDEG